MIVDILTKFNYKKKIWMTPEHPMCARTLEYRVMYGAIMISQAKLNKSDNPLNNLELQRLLKYGLKMSSSDIAWSLRNSKEQSVIIDYLLENIKNDRDRVLLIMDIVNVTMRQEPVSKDENASIRMFAKMFSVEFETLDLIWNFMNNAFISNAAECKRIGMMISGIVPSIEISDLRYYITDLKEDIECTQELLDEKKIFRIVDSCRIKEDIVLYSGMTLTIDHANVSVYGNIVLEGGNLIIKNSRIVRKTDNHRACINIKKEFSNLQVSQCDVDCRNFGMFIRAEAGRLAINDTVINNTTRGAAIRFWGDILKVVSCRFSNCYSPEDGGAIMAKSGAVMIEDCYFSDCEAKRGGAVYAVDGSSINNCEFKRCNVAEYGAALYYSGVSDGKVSGIVFSHCHPQGAEIVQHISGRQGFNITGEYTIQISTLIDCPVYVDSKARLIVKNASLYINYPIYCNGSLYMKNARVKCNNLENSDMIYIDGSKECRIQHCEFDGMMRTGGLNIRGSRISVSNSLFRNMNGGRAIYNAYFPDITECIFNFCQSGAIYCQGGNIEKCVFVNCRAKSGAGIKMYGNKGVINRCNFKRCVSEYSGGAIDRAVGQRAVKCLYEDCLPDNIV